MNLHDICNNTPRWALMWLLAGMLFYVGKAVTLFRAWKLRTLRGPAWKMAAYVFAWPGMDFRAWIAGTARPEKSEVALIVSEIAIGSALLWVAARQLTSPLAAGWVGMTGLMLLVHFGLFHAVAVVWQKLGIDAKPIMSNPVAAVSIADFWGRRWNLAFRDLTHAFVFRPMSRRRGKGPALWASFAMSGLVHDLVISVPAGGGYGLPTAYFLLQALGITIQRRIAKRSWWFTHVFTALPAFALFHPPFVERVMVPFFQVIGALP